MGLKIYVGCLPGDATEVKVKQIFQAYGQIANVTLVTKKTDKCVGSGYVTCSDEVTRDAILASEVYYGSRKLETSLYLDQDELQAFHEDINVRKLLIKNLPHNTTNDELKEKFSIFGEVINAFISTDQKAGETATSTYGIVIYQERADAYKALNGKFLLKGKPVIVRLHRFRNVGEAIYIVRGKKIKAKDLIDIQVGLQAKEDIRDIMPQSYQNEVFRFMGQEQKYQDMMKVERKKLRKDLKKKKGDELLIKLMQADNEDSSPTPQKNG
jgi:RNA recognition motif-containing protein